MTPPETMRQVLADVGPILLDFDGPVCDIFASYPAPHIAAELREVLVDKGIELPEPVMAQDDPLEVLRWTGTLGQNDLARTVEDAMCAAELRAVETAMPTPYAREVIVAARQADRAVAIVSNNSAPAVAAYLTAHRLASHVGPVIGRAYAEPRRMKPNPEPILRAVFELNARPAACALVGDSLTDITGAQAAGVRSIAYANKPGKAARFTTANADAVVPSMAEVATALLDLLP